MIGVAEAARDAEFEKIVQFLKAKMAANCIECEKQEWQVFHDLNTTAFRTPFRPSLIGMRDGSITGKSMPMVAVVCGNCGYAKLFSTKVVLGNSDGTQ